MRWCLCAIALVTIFSAKSLQAEAHKLQWKPVEIELRSEQSHPWWEYPVEAVWTHSGTATQVRQKGFASDPQTYTLRFAPPLSGEWTYRTISANDPALDSQTGRLQVSAPTATQLSENPNLRGPLKIGPTQRCFVYADGTPFFLLADTLWAANTTRCGLGKDCDGPFFQYLADRKKCGFTAVLIAFIRGFGDTKDSVAQGNEGGQPFFDSGFTQINHSFFAATDNRLEAFWDHGFVVAAHPTWFGKRNCVFTLTDAERLLNYLIVRYGAYNVIWSLSGEYQYAMRDCRWTAGDLDHLGESAQAHNAFHNPVSIHPSSGTRWEFPHGQQSSRGFHHSKWLDHHWLQTGQQPETMSLIPIRLQEDLSLSPPRPVFMSEACYERVTDPEHAYHARWQAWVAFLNGAAGYGYGAFGVWQFYDPNEPTSSRESAGADVIPWQKALTLEGSRQMKPVADLLTSLDWWDLKGLPVLGQGNSLAGKRDLSRPQAAVNPGGTCVIYFPRGHAQERFHLANSSETSYSARWFDPRTGSEQQVSEKMSGNLPPRPSEEDWVLILEPKKK